MGAGEVKGELPEKTDGYRIECRERHKVEGSTKLLKQKTIPSDREEWLFIILCLLRLLCKRIEATWRYSTRLLCGKLAIL